MRVHIVFDMDGDGKDELLFEGKKGERYLRWTSLGPLAEPLAMRSVARGDASFAKMSLATSTPVDIDADGIVELAGLIPGEHVRLFRWNTGAKEFQSIWQPIPAIRATARKRLGGEPPSHFIDLNGDALPDLVKVGDATIDWGRLDYTRKWTYWLNLGDSFGPPVPIAGAIQSLPCQTRVQSASTGVDLRGDHRGTLIVGAMVTRTPNRVPLPRSESHRARRLRQSRCRRPTDQPATIGEARIRRPQRGRITGLGRPAKGWRPPGLVEYGARVPRERWRSVAIRRGRRRGLARRRYGRGRR